jgi:hypothetical protein
MVKPTLRHDRALAAIGAALLAVVLGSVTGPRPATAQQATEQDATPPTMPSPALQQACANDVRTLCAGVMPGGGRIKQCFIAKRAQLSTGCKSALLAARIMSSK